MENTKSNGMGEAIQYHKMEEKVGYNRHLCRQTVNMNHPNPSRFVHGPWSERRRVHILYLMYRITMLIFTLGSTLYGSISYFDNGMFFIYFSNWTFIILTIYMTFSAFVVWKEFIKERTPNRKIESIDGRKYSKMPMSFKIVWVLFNIAIPMGIFTTIAFWTLVRRNSLQNPQSEKYEILFLVANAFYCCIDIVIAGPPMRIQHVVQPVFFGLGYILFNYLYVLFGGHGLEGLNYVYTYLDWFNYPVDSVICAAGGLFMAIYIYIVCCLISSLRSVIIKKLGGSYYSSNFRQQCNGDFNNGFVDDA